MAKNAPRTGTACRAPTSANSAAASRPVARASPRKPRYTLRRVALRQLRRWTRSPLQLGSSPAMIARLVLMLLLTLGLLVGTHYFVYHSVVRAFVIEQGAVRKALFGALLFLSLSFPAAVVLVGRVRARERTQARGARGDRARARPVRDDPREASQDRRADQGDRPEGVGGAGRVLPVGRGIPRGVAGPPATGDHRRGGHGLRLSPARPRPRGGGSRTDRHGGEGAVRPETSLGASHIPVRHEADAPGEISRPSDRVPASDIPHWWPRQGW